MRTLFVALLVLAVPAAASAQNTLCPYGLVAVDGAHCCWPGQVFAEVGCKGTPQCPAGLAPTGDTCVVSQASPQPATAAPAVPPPPPPVGLPPSLPPPPTYLSVPAAATQLASTVRFEAQRADDSFSVSVDGGAACKTPCDLAVPPGRHRVSVEGDASYQEELDFPAQASVVKVGKRRAGRTALGVVGLSVGIPVGVVGALVSFAALTIAGTGGNTSRDFFFGGAAAAVAGFSFAGIGAGVGFGTAGSNKATLETAPAVTLISLGAAPTSHGGMVGATFAF